MGMHRRLARIVPVIVTVAAVAMTCLTPSVAFAKTNVDAPFAKTSDDMDFTLDGSLFENSPSEYNKELAVAAANMCNEAQGDDGSKIENLLKQTEGWNAEAGNYGESAAYCIGHGNLTVDGAPTMVLVVVLRGSTTLKEFVGDAFKGSLKSVILNGNEDEWKPEFLGEKVWHNVFDFEEQVWGYPKGEITEQGIYKYLQDHPEIEKSKHLKILVTGHSLGGAVASMVAARMTTLVGRGEWLASNVSEDDIYCYTFGAINVLADKAKGIEEGFENIHNVYNKWDSFGPNGNINWKTVLGALGDGSASWTKKLLLEFTGEALKAAISSPGSKWGHTDMLDHKYKESDMSVNNHDMGNYLNCVRGTCDNHCEVDTQCKVAAAAAGDESDDADDASDADTKDTTATDAISGTGWQLRVPAYWQDAVSVKKSSAKLNGEKVTTYDFWCDDIRSTSGDEPVLLMEVREYPSKNAKKHLTFGGDMLETSVTLKSGQKVKVYTSEMGYEMLVPLTSGHDLVLYACWQAGQGPLYSKDKDEFHDKVEAFADLQSFGSVTSYDDYDMDTVLDCLKRIGSKYLSVGKYTSVGRTFDCDGFIFTVPTALLDCSGVSCEESNGLPSVKLTTGQGTMPLLWVESNTTYWDQAGEDYVFETRGLSNGTLKLALGDDDSILACLTGANGTRAVFCSFVFSDNMTERFSKELTRQARSCQATTAGVSAKGDPQEIAVEFMAAIAKGIEFEESSGRSSDSSGSNSSNEPDSNSGDEPSGPEEPQDEEPQVESQSTGERISLGGYSFGLPAYWSGKVDVLYDRPYKFCPGDQTAVVCVKGTDYAVFCLSYKGDHSGATWASPAAWASDGGSRVEWAAVGANAQVGVDAGGEIGALVPSKWFSISRNDEGGYSDGPDGYDSQEVADQVADLQGLGNGTGGEALIRQIMSTAQPE